MTNDNTTPRPGAAFRWTPSGWIYIGAPSQPR